MAATITPTAAMAAAAGYVRNAPTSTRNSPTNPFVAGGPIDERDTMGSTAANNGTTLAIPPDPPISRGCRRPYTLATRENKAPVEMTGLILNQRRPRTTRRG